MTTTTLAPDPAGRLPLPDPWPGRSLDPAWRCRECGADDRPVYVLDAPGVMSCRKCCWWSAPTPFLGRVDLDARTLEVFPAPLYLMGEPGRAKREVPPREATRPKGRHPQHEEIIRNLLADVAHAKANGLPSPFAPEYRPGSRFAAGRKAVARRRAAGGPSLLEPTRR